MSQLKSGSKGIYYGWVVVVTGFIIFTVAFAIQFSFGIFLKPIQETFGWSRTTISWAIAIHLMVYALSMIPVGWAIDRVNTRLLYSVDAVLVGLSLVFSARVSEPWQLYLLYGLSLGIGLCISGPVIIALVTRWFTEKRGVALGIITAGVGFGNLVGATLSSFLISSYGWRDAFTILGIGSAIILLGCSFFIRTSQAASQVGLQVTGSAPGTIASPPPEMNFRQTLKTRNIALILLANVFIGFTVRTVSVHIAPHATDVGISSWIAALAAGTIGAAGVAGRLIMGFVQDKIGPKRSLLICMTMQGLSLLALPLVRTDLAFFAFAIVFGFTYGGDVPQTPALIAQCFGVASITLIYGLVMTVNNLAGSLGPIVAGYIFDETGSYTMVFLGMAASLFAGVFCISRVARREQERQPFVKAGKA